MARERERERTNATLKCVKIETIHIYQSKQKTTLPVERRKTKLSKKASAGLSFERVWRSIFSFAKRRPTN